MFVVRPVTAVLLGYRNYRLGSYRTVIDPGAAPRGVCGNSAQPMTLQCCLSASQIENN